MHHEYATSKSRIQRKKKKSKGFGCTSSRLDWVIHDRHHSLKVVRTSTEPAPNGEYFGLDPGESLVRAALLGTPAISTVNSGLLSAG